MKDKVMEHILEVRNLKKVFVAKSEKYVATDDVSFAVDAGECVGIVGQSGCGKSTLAKIIAGFIAPDSGQIFLCGRDITYAKGAALRTVYANMQMIFQMPEESFDPRKTIGWSVAEPLRNLRPELGRKQTEERTRCLLAEVGLSPSFADRYPHELSGGQCQRAAIARAVAISPKLLICDEATSALDMTVAAKTIDLLRRLCFEQQIACLFITHDLALLTRIAERVIVMHNGKIVEEGTTQQIIYGAKSPRTKELAAAALVMTPPVTEGT